MKTNTPLTRLILISSTTFFLLSLYLAGRIIENTAASSQSAFPTTEKSDYQLNEVASSNAPLPAPAPCPSPTVRSGNQCIVTADVLLSQTLVLPSNTTLNCQGHKLTATVPATDPMPNSQPQVGIFLNNVKDVLIERCVLENFDFGVFAIRSKRPSTSPGNSFLLVDNIINARYTGVSLNAVDDAEIINNTISYSRATGRALYIGRDSDFNSVARNTFISNLVVGGSDRSFRVPGKASSTNPVLGPLSPREVVVITQVEGPEPVLINMTIGNRLFQVTSTDILDPSFTCNLQFSHFDRLCPFSEGNRFEGNTIRFGAVPVDGLVLAVPQGTQVIGNTIEGGGANAIRVGLQLNDKIFPGTCSKLPSRNCFDNDGCNIDGVDLVSRGTCTPNQTKSLTWVSGNTRIEGNTISGPVEFGITTGGRFTTIIGNTIVGPLRDPSANDPKKVAGIRLAGKFALESSTVTNNSVSSASVAFGLIQSAQKAEPISFTAKVSLNHFSGFTIGVLTSKTELLQQIDPMDIYTLETELSVGTQGNFWGGTVTCRSLKAADVQNIDGSENHQVHDNHPCPFASP